MPCAKPDGLAPLPAQVIPLNVHDRRRTLENAGLIVLEESCAEARTSPEQGWKSVINMAVAPSARVLVDAEDHLLQADSAWKSWARLNDLFDQDGSFFISIQGVGAFALPWAKVRLGECTQLAAAFANEHGQPEFVTMAIDEHAICGVTAEEDEIWIACASNDGLPQSAGDL